MGYRDSKCQTHWVPPAFITDLASQPAITRPVLDRNGKSRRPSALHDYKYCVKQGTRKEADDLFLEALESEGVNMITRRMMWLAVRAWGWTYWNKRDGITSEDFVDEPQPQ
jgi:hypothetical protein